MYFIICWFEVQIPAGGTKYIFDFRLKIAGWRMSQRHRQNEDEDARAFERGERQELSVTRINGSRPPSHAIPQRPRQPRTSIAARVSRVGLAGKHEDR